MKGSTYIVATVAEWNDDEGWGVLEADAFPDGIWVHFSAINADGYQTLRPGQSVEVDVEGPLTFDQDGYRHRARDVVVPGQATRHHWPATDPYPSSDARTASEGIREE